MKSFLVQPFGQRIHVTGNPQEFVKRYNGYAPDTERMELKELESCRGMAAHLEHKTKGALFMLFMASGAEDSTLFHEALHLTHYVMDFSEVPISMESSETQAYLMEHIAVTARKKLR